MMAWELLKIYCTGYMVIMLISVAIWTQDLDLAHRGTRGYQAAYWFGVFIVALTWPAFLLVASVHKFHLNNNDNKGNP